MTPDLSRHYEDIIDLERPASLRHAPMPRMARAAQFTPFAALNGYEDAVQNTADLNERSFERPPEDPLRYLAQDLMCEGDPP